MEFVEASELDGILEDNGIVAQPPAGACAYLRLERDGAVRYHVAAADSEVEPADGATARSSETAELPRIIERILNRLHVDQLLLVPVAEWRNAFDAVAFSLAANEDWQEFDAAATVGRNSRDPILCGPADFGMLIEVVSALYEDAEGAEQAIQLLFPAVPLLIEVHPGGALRIECGTEVISDEVVAVLPSA